MFKKIAIPAFLAILLMLAFYAKRNFFKPQQSHIKVKKEGKFLLNHEELRNGDLIFQVSQSSQSKAIQSATKSKYSHCGIIFNDLNKIYVLEAIQPVKKTLFENWIAKGQDGHFVIKRLKNAEQILTPEVLKKMHRIENQFMGRNYDLTFEWSDDKIYCSELIWKIYKRAADIEIGQLQKLSNFDLSNEVVKDKIRERYGSQIPLDESVISPVAIFESDLLETITVK